MAVIGIAAHTRGMGRARALMAAAEASGTNGAVMRLLLGWRLTELWRLVKQVLLGSVGVLAMFLPPAMASEGFRLFVALYSRFALISAEAIMVGLSLRAYSRSLSSPIDTKV